jgi:hypothetical protein
MAEVSSRVAAFAHRAYKGFRCVKSLEQMS